MTLPDPHPAFAVTERLAPQPATREEATTDAWVRHYAALALAAYAEFYTATHSVHADAEPGSRPNLGYLSLIATTATSAAVALATSADYAAEEIWDLTPQAGALNGEWEDWLTSTLDMLGVNPADIDQRFQAEDFVSPSQAAAMAAGLNAEGGAA